MNLNKDRILVVAPHPDDETLGCGGTLLRDKAEGASVHWLIVTRMTSEGGFGTQKQKRRQKEIQMVNKMYRFNTLHQLNFPTSQLEKVPQSELIQKMREVFLKTQPTLVYLPFRGDIHSDHRYTFDAALSCTKSFRQSSVRKLLAYETLSETDFGLIPGVRFEPNVYVDIARFLDQKIKIMKVYKDELETFPSPRSEEAIRALARFRGATSGFKAAESFVLLKERR